MAPDAAAARPWPRRVKTPTRLQMEAVECGAASLAIILAHHGRHVPLEELRTACGVSRDGSKASNVVRAAAAYGLVAKGFKKELDDLAGLAPPYVAFWNFNHFLVVEGFGPGVAYLNDPAYGPRKVTMREFDEGFTGVVLTFAPGPAFERKAPATGMFAALRARLAGSEAALGYALAAGALLVVPTAAIPVFTQVFVDQVLVHHATDWLRPLLLGLALMAALIAALRRLEIMVLNRLRMKLAVALTGKFMWHLLRLPVGFFAQRYAGELVDRAAKNDLVAEEVTGKLALAGIDVVLLAAYAALLLLYDVPLALIAVAFGALQLAALRWVVREREDASLRLGIEEGKAVGVGVTGLQTIETLKASGLESDFFARWAGYHARAMNTRQALARQDRWLAAMPGLLAGLAGAAVLGVGGLRVMDGHLSLGMLIAIQGLVAGFLGPVERLVALGARLQQLQAALTGLDDVLVQPVDPQTAPPAPDAPAYEGPARLRGAVELVDVAFGFSPLAPPVLEGFSFRAEPGQRVAIVGGSGSGKSTVAKLLAGLYEPWRGEVRLDDRPRGAIPRAVRTRSVALVDQDLVFFAGTVRENLTLWDATVPDPDLAAACRDAEIQDVVLALAGGYDGRLLEGAANLSGGQRQRLEIARALAADPSILILDEATSALDAETERLIDGHLRKRGCTCVIVAHRLSTIRDADEIIVLERGQVVQRGRHEALMAEDGAYARLIGADGPVPAPAARVVPAAPATPPPAPADAGEPALAPATRPAVDPRRRPARPDDAPPKERP